MELILVLLLLGILVSFTLPNLDNRLADTANLETWFNVNIREFKIRARQLGKPLFLTYDRKVHAFFVGPVGDAPLFELELPPELRVMGMVSRGGLGASKQIRFHPEGYADYTALHLVDREQGDFTLMVYPFLSRVGLRKGHYRFDQDV